MMYLLLAAIALLSVVTATPLGAARDRAPLVKRASDLYLTCEPLLINDNMMDESWYISDAVPLPDSSGVLLSVYKDGRQELFLESLYGGGLAFVNPFQLFLPELEDSGSNFALASDGSLVAYVARNHSEAYSSFQVYATTVPALQTHVVAPVFVRGQHNDTVIQSQLTFTPDNTQLLWREAPFAAAESRAPTEAPTHSPTPFSTSFAPGTPAPTNTPAPTPAPTASNAPSAAPSPAPTPATDSPSAAPTPAPTATQCVDNSVYVLRIANADGSGGELTLSPSSIRMAADGGACPLSVKSFKLNHAGDVVYFVLGEQDNDGVARFNNLYRVNLDGTGLQKLTAVGRGATGVIDFQIAPNDAFVIFEQPDNDGAARKRLYSVPAAGGLVERITTNSILSTSRGVDRFLITPDSVHVLWTGDDDSATTDLLYKTTVVNPQAFRVELTSGLTVAPSTDFFLRTGVREFALANDGTTVVFRSSDEPKRNQIRLGADRDGHDDDFHVDYYKDDPDYENPGVADGYRFGGGSSELYTVDLNDGQPPQLLSTANAYDADDDEQIDSGVYEFVVDSADVVHFIARRPGHARGLYAVPLPAGSAPVETLDEVSTEIEGLIVTPDCTVIYRDNNAPNTTLLACLPPVTTTTTLVTTTTTVGPTTTTTTAPATTTTTNTNVATTDTPSQAPSPGPTHAPSPGPTNAPSPGPTNAPSPGPTNAPSPGPTNAPSPGPTNAPSPGPTNAPSPGPTNAPSPGPTSAPSLAPSPAPSSSPSAAPSPAPSVAPSAAPTPGPTVFVIGQADDDETPDCLICDEVIAEEEDLAVIGGEIDEIDENLGDDAADELSEASDHLDTFFDYLDDAEGEIDDIDEEDGEVIEDLIDDLRKFGVSAEKDDCRDKFKDLSGVLERKRSVDRMLATHGESGVMARYHAARLRKRMAQKRSAKRVAAEHVLKRSSHKSTLQQELKELREIADGNAGSSRDATSRVAALNARVSRISRDERNLEKSISDAREEESDRHEELGEKADANQDLLALFHKLGDILGLDYDADGGGSERENSGDCSKESCKAECSRDGKGSRCVESCLRDCRK